MPEYIKAPTGAFCWIELSTTDVAAAKRFYGSLFDWTIADMPMPMSDGSAYAMASLGDKNVAGIMKQPAEAKKMGAPAHWLSYVAVDDAAATAQKVTALGGKVLVSPFEMGPGKMAVVQDPTGGVLALWQSQQSMGTFLFGEPSSMGWNELSSTNVDRSGSFYAGLFGWKLEIAKMPGMDYVTFKNGDELAGGMMAQPKELAGAPSSWGVYFAVADADATAAKAQALGATVIVPPTDIPTIGRFAVVLDPQGVAFSVIKFLPRAS
jgi:predicted enzyme related to lactoylglutathione lyase